MKITDIEDSYIEITDFDNFFDIYEDENGNYSFNLNETMYLDIDEKQYQYHTCDTECFWPLISYKLYETPRLAWFLMKINGVKAKNMFQKKMPGDVIRYLPVETVNYILGSMNA